MARRHTLTMGVADLVSRRAKDNSDKAMKLAILRYRHLKSRSENATDISEKVKLYEMALTCLANSVEKESARSAL
jgi:hypothetical protein